MPLVNISLRSGKSDKYRLAIMDGVYRAMTEEFSVPDDDQFMTVSEHSDTNFRFGTAYLNIDRSDDLVFIQITANNTRTIEQKKALFRRIAEILGKNPGIRPEDVFTNIVEVEKENWSLGLGVAQYA